MVNCCYKKKERWFIHGKVQLHFNQWRTEETTWEVGVWFLLYRWQWDWRGHALSPSFLPSPLSPFHYHAIAHHGEKKSTVRCSYSVRHHQFVMFNLWWNAVIVIFCCAHFASTCLINFSPSEWFPRMTLSSCQRTASHNRNNQWFPSVQVRQGSLIVKLLGVLSQSAMLNLLLLCEHSSV